MTNSLSLFFRFWIVVCSIVCSSLSNAQSDDLPKFEDPENPPPGYKLDQPSKQDKSLKFDDLKDDKSNAGYDKTSWGMSIAKVKSLYPGGHLLKSQNGDSTMSYVVVRPIGGSSPAYVSFDFSIKGGLRDVLISFAAGNVLADFKKHKYNVDIPRDEALELFNLMLDNLERKYGQPLGKGKPSEKKWVEWNKDDNYIWIKLTHGSDPQHSNVGIFYSNFLDTYHRTKEGL